MTIRVKLLENDERFKLQKGDIFEAERYHYDPGKISLLKRESDGFDPECNQYKESLAYWMQGQWMVLESSKYVPYEDDDDDDDDFLEI